jgi:predicted nucleotidyltransferase
VDTSKSAISVDEAFLRDIVERVLAVASPDKIILFGSAAEGGLTADSDIDLLIVEKDPGDRQREYVRIREALRGLGRPFDLILISTEWFEESKDVIGGIAYPAHKYGKVLYESA